MDFIFMDTALFLILYGFVGARNLNLFTCPGNGSGLERVCCQKIIIGSTKKKDNAKTFMKKSGISCFGIRRIIINIS